MDQYPKELVSEVVKMLELFIEICRNNLIVTMFVKDEVDEKYKKYSQK